MDADDHVDETRPAGRAMDHVSSERSRSQTDEKALSLAVEVKLLLVQSCQSTEQSPQQMLLRKVGQVLGGLLLYTGSRSLHTFKTKSERPKGLEAKSQGMKTKVKYI